MSEPRIDAIGIGNAIVDVLTHADEAFLEQHGLTKGAMTLIDAEQSERLYAVMQETRECSGGSAANTMVGLAGLGGRSAYIGKVRDDGLGRVFRADIREAGVAYETHPAASGPSTGRCLVFVTSDAQRTLQTYLGISAELSPEDVVPQRVRGARITYLEGYLWDPPAAKEAFLKAATIAHEAGRKVALSLSDAFCVDRHREEFQELVENHVDVLFANEDEIVSLYRSEDFDEAVRAVRGKCAVAALTRGPHGSVIVTPDDVVCVAAEPVGRVVDTTGAGDLYASGFLFGLTQERELATCARIGGIAAAEVIAHVGARPDVSLKDLVAEKLG